LTQLGRGVLVFNRFVRFNCLWNWARPAAPTALFAIADEVLK
jgi:hypothetical protein